MYRLKILVTGIIRNGENTIAKEIQAIQNALSNFREVHWLIVESDSQDGTIEKLLRLEAEIDRFRFVTLGRLADRITLRTERIAYCRNSYLRELEENEAYQDIDYVLIADFDGVNNQLNSSALESCWKRNDWDACTANQNGPYYDIWALRHSEWSPNDCWKTYDFLKQNNYSTAKALEVAVFGRMISIPTYQSWIPVRSAFGGLALYKKAALKGLRYLGKTENGEEICEHVHLHEQMCKKNRKIFINPTLINTGYTDHSKATKPFPSIIRLFKIALIDGLIKRFIGAKKITLQHKPINK